jgi:hypothetical protein
MQRLFFTTCVIGVILLILPGTKGPEEGSRVARLDAWKVSFPLAIVFVVSKHHTLMTPFHLLGQESQQGRTALLQRLLPDPHSVTIDQAESWDRDEFQHATDVLQEKAKVETHKQLLMLLFSCR